MSDVIGNIVHWPSRSGGRENVNMMLVAVLGAAGVVSSYSRQDDPGFTLAKDAGTTGKYDLVYPDSAEPVMIKVSCYSPLGSIGQAYVSAKNFAAGTASIIASTPAGVAAYGASGDEIVIEIETQLRDV